MRKIVSRVARLPLMRRVIAWVFAYMSFAIPLDRLHQTPTLIAFHHPQPSYPLHILIVPRRPRRDLCALGSADSDFMVDLFAAVALLVARFDLERHGYRLIVNGGAYQDIPQLHFHLISDAERGT